MSKILIKELQDVLGVSKNNANAFVQQLSQKYLIDLVPVEDLKGINATAGTLGSPLTEDEIKTLDSIAAGVEGVGPDGEKYADGNDEDLQGDDNYSDKDQSIAEADYPVDASGEEIKEGITQDDVGEYRSSDELTDEQIDAKNFSFHQSVD